MKQKIFGYIAREINRLTSDEDIRQDLWVFFLEGNSPFSFQKYLDEMYAHAGNSELNDGT